MVPVGLYTTHTLGITLYVISVTTLSVIITLSVVTAPDDAAGLGAEALQCGACVLDRAVEALDSHLAVTVDRPETTSANLPFQTHLCHTASSHITSTPGAVASLGFGSTGGGAKNSASTKIVH